MDSQNEISSPKRQMVGVEDPPINPQRFRRQTPPPPYHSLSHFNDTATGSGPSDVESTASPPPPVPATSALKLALLNSDFDAKWSDFVKHRSVATPDDTLNYPFPTRVSPSDVEIGIVTPGSEWSEQSSVTGHLDGPKPTLFDILPTDDVIVAHILPCVPLPSLFALRGTCTRARDIVNAYFRQCPAADLSLFAWKFGPLPFHVMTRDARRLKSLYTPNAKQWLTDELLIPVIKRNPQLVKADFSACSTVSNKSVHVLAVTAGANLLKLCLKDCHWLSCDAVLDLSLKCKRLQHIDLSGCWDVADDVVINLVSTNRELTFLSLAKIYGITDKTVEQIAHRCRRLQTLNLLGCWRVSNNAVKALAEFSTSLKSLSIRENTNVTEASLGLLRRRKVDVDVPPPPMGSRGLNLAHPVFQQPQMIDNGKYVYLRW